MKLSEFVTMPMLEPLLLSREDNFLFLILPIFSGYASEPLIINTQTVTQQIKV